MTVRWLLLVVLVLCWSGTAQARDVFVLAIGNNAGHADEVPLSYAERDAGQIAHVLKRLGGADAENTAVMLGHDASRIKFTLGVINSRIAALPKERRAAALLVVFYSGHADARGLHPGATTLTYGELRTLVELSAAGGRLIVIDGCRSGALTRVKGGRRAKPFEIAADNRIDATGIAIITSSTAGEDSHESERLRGSFFSHHFANAMRGVADFDADGDITLSEAYSYAYDQTLRSSGKTSQLQHPTFEKRLSGSGDLTLTEPGRFGRHTGELVLPRPGRYLIMRSRQGGAVVAEIDVDEGGRAIRLPPGSYFVQERQATSYLESAVAIGTGSRVDLADVGSRKIAYARLVRKGGAVESSHTLGVVLGARGAVIDGLSPHPHFALRYVLDLPWLSFGVRGRFTTGAAPSTTGLTYTRTTETALGLTAERYVDFEAVSLSLGLWGEAVYFHQGVEASLAEPDRHQLGGGFGALAAIERDFFIPEAVFRIEGGPMTLLYRRAVTAGGIETDAALATRFTWWFGGGMAWRF